MQLCIAFAQNKVNFNIHHMLESDNFGFEKIASNNINTDFKVTRMEYYISEISIIHDGGHTITLPDLWILVNAADVSSTLLGDYPVQHIEKVIFHVGVDAAHNNGDPSVYDEAHPLALKLPSMHWGWAIGYNFVALEGVGGSELNKVFQIHALGNENYKTIEINVDENVVDGVINIDIAADYSKSMYDLDASIGIFYHGTAKQSRSLMDNFQKYVFSNATGVSSSDIIDPVFQFEVLPTLLRSNTSFNVKSDILGEYSIVLSDISGRKIYQRDGINMLASIDPGTLAPGNYIVTAIKGGKNIAAKKLSVYGE